MRVAYILTPISFGGAERVTLMFLENVNRSKFHIYPVLFVRPWEEENIFTQMLQSLCLDFHRIPVAKKPGIEGKDYLRILRVFKMVWYFLKQGSFDLVHTHGYFADIIGIPASRMLGIPHMSTCHGFIFNDLALQIYNSLDIFLLRLSDRVIAVSDEIKEDLIRFGVARSRISVIQNALGIKSQCAGTFLEERERTRREYHIDSDQIVLGYIGRFSQEKGLSYFIDGLARLKNQGFSVRAMLIGDGPLRSQIEVLALQHGVRDLTIFTGFQGDVSKFMPAMDIFVLPSLSEGTPMVLLEAMGSGIPVVASAVGGIPRILESGVNGILVPPRQPEEIAAAVAQIVENKMLSTRLSKMARETVEKSFNVHQWVRKIESEYTKVIDKKIRLKK
jgi:glycosyltransferase involved in cell wall biosynthesis